VKQDAFEQDDISHIYGQSTKSGSGGTHLDDIQIMKSRKSEANKSFENTQAQEKKFTMKELQYLNKKPKFDYLRPST